MFRKARLRIRGPLVRVIVWHGFFFLILNSRNGPTLDSRFFSAHWEYELSRFACATMQKKAQGLQRYQTYPVSLMGSKSTKVRPNWVEYLHGKNVLQTARTLILIKFVEIYHICLWWNEIKWAQRIILKQPAVSLRYNIRKTNEKSHRPCSGNSSKMLLGYFCRPTLVKRHA